MAKNSPDEKLVYLTLKRVFQGQDVHIRNKKKVWNTIAKQKNQADIRHLIQQYDKQSLCQVAQTLLKDQVFESTLNAKKRFPEVFAVSPNQTAERAISESNAAKKENAAIQSVTEKHQDKPAGPIIKSAEPSIKPAEFTIKTPKPSIKPPEPSTKPAEPSIKPPEPASKPVENTDKLATGCQNKGTKSDSQGILASVQEELSTPGSSLYPVYLPLEIQHRILARIQTILEMACYVYAQKTLGDVLQKEGWECAEAVELNRWPKVFLTYRDKLDQSSLEGTGKSLTVLFDSIAQLRHTAVHRLRLTANRTLQFVIDAETLAKLIQDEDTVQILSVIRQQVQATMEDMERNKDLLESRMATTKAQFAARKAELERQEREALEDIVKEDKEYTAFAGESLEQALDAPANGVDSQESMDEESFSDTDSEDHIADEVGLTWWSVVFGF